VDVLSDCTCCYHLSFASLSEVRTFELFYIFVGFYNHLKWIFPLFVIIGKTFCSDFLLESIENPCLFVWSTWVVKSMGTD